MNLAIVQRFQIIGYSKNHRIFCTMELTEELHFKHLGKNWYIIVKHFILVKTFLLYAVHSFYIERMLSNNQSEL